MKKTWIILLLVAALAIFIFRDPILDFLPIDQSRWVEREGNRYLLDEDGDPRTGWYSQEGIRYYFREDGVLHTGWLEENGSRYYLGSDGGLKTGWVEMDGKRHYFDTQGRLATGLLEEGGKRFYLDENGCATNGWQQVGESFCYVTESGTIPSGWMELEGQKYYLNDRGFRCTGWLDDSSGRYYFDAQGVMATGWLHMAGNSYYMNENGAMADGWTQIGDATYYFDEFGNRHTGWLEENGKRYYLNPDGTLRTGWLEEDGNRYYLLEDGSAAVGKLEINGEVFFFSSTGMNFIMVNPWHSLPEDFEPELVELAGGHQGDPVCIEALEKMLADCRAAGFRPTIVSSYRTIERQKANLQRMINSYTSKGYSYDRAYAIATQIVAVPGTSEHHLGLAFDIVDSAYVKLNYQQAEMPTQKWLMEHCWEYGFILRYPEDTTDITGIIWEPWHYRYVGVEMALEIRDLGGIPLEIYIDNLTGDGTTCGGKRAEE